MWAHQIYPSIKSTFEEDWGTLEWFVGVELVQGVK